MEHPVWEIKWILTKDFSSYFESETKYDIQVINKLNGEVFKTFFRNEYANSTGDHDTGVRDIYFSEDGKSLVVINETGKKEIYLLPVF